MGMVPEDTQRVAAFHGFPSTINYGQDSSGPESFQRIPEPSVTTASFDYRQHAPGAHENDVTTSAFLGIPRPECRFLAVREATEQIYSLESRKKSAWLPYCSLFTWLAVRVRAHRMSQG